MSLKQSNWLVAWRAHRWSIFPAEREFVVAHLMLLVFYELKSLCRCVLLHMLIACVYVSPCMYAFVCERGRENNCVFQVEGQLLSLLLSIQQPSSLWRGLREALFRCCRGVDAGWLDASFQNHFPSKGTTHGWQAFLHLNKRGGEKIPKMYSYLCKTIEEKEILYNT